MAWVPAPASLPGARADGALLLAGRPRGVQHTVDSPRRSNVPAPTLTRTRGGAIGFIDPRLIMLKPRFVSAPSQWRTRPKLSRGRRWRAGLFSATGFAGAVAILVLALGLVQVTWLPRTTAALWARLAAVLLAFLLIVVAGRAAYSAHTGYGPGSWRRSFGAAAEASSTFELP